MASVAHRHGTQAHASSNHPPQQPPTAPLTTSDEEIISQNAPGPSQPAHPQHQAAWPGAGPALNTHTSTPGRTGLVKPSNAPETLPNDGILTSPNPGSGAFAGNLLTDTAAADERRHDTTDTTDSPTTSQPVPTPTPHAQVLVVPLPLFTPATTGRDGTEAPTPTGEPYLPPTSPR